MAEVITNEVYGKNYHATSAGINVFGKCPMQYDALAALQRAGYDVTKIHHVSRRLTYDMVKAADIVIAVNCRYASALHAAYPDCAGKITCFANDIDIPYDGDTVGYDRCFYELCEGIESILCPGGFRG